jgi:hypothetical protein
MHRKLSYQICRTYPNMIGNESEPNFKHLVDQIQTMLHLTIYTD